MQSAIELFRERVVIKPSGCWEWIGPFSKIGHPRFNFDNNKPLAHRWIYELLVGNIEEGHKLHHLCENPSCINPSHVTPVTQLHHMLVTPNNPARINRLKQKCKRGHNLFGDNLYIAYKNGRPIRQCKICVRLAGKRYWKRKKLLKSQA